MEMLNALGIHWKVLLGQIINFLILLYLLNRFVFKGFLDLLKKRKEKIESGIKKEREYAEKIEMTKKERENVLKRAQEKSVRLLEEAEKKAKEKEREILALAEKEKQRMIEEGKKIGKIEAARLKEELFQKNIELVSLLTGKILKEKIDPEKDKKFIEEKLTQLKYEG